MIVWFHRIGESVACGSCGRYSTVPEQQKYWKIVSVGDEEGIQRILSPSLMVVSIPGVLIVSFGYKLEN